MLNTFWKTKTGSLLIVEAIATVIGTEDEKVCTLTDGHARFSYPEAKLMQILNGEVSDPELERYDPNPASFEYHAILADQDNERTAQLYQTMQVNCMAVTARRIVPFQEVQGTGNVKETTTTLDKSIGFWRHAHPILEQNPENEEQLVIRLVLSGEIFKSVCRDPELMEQEMGVGSVYRVMPMMRKVETAIDAMGVMVNNIDFDMQPMITEEPEPASDETYALKG